MFDEERFFFIGSNGKLIDYNNSKKNLPYVFGKIDVDNFVHFVEVVEQSKFDFNKITIPTCGSGVTACVLGFALEFIGKNNWQVYDGSWSEWGSMKENLIE